MFYFNGNNIFKCQKIVKNIENYTIRNLLKAEKKRFQKLQHKNTNENKNVHLFFKFRFQNPFILYTKTTFKLQVCYKCKVQSLCTNF